MMHLYGKSSESSEPVVVTIEGANIVSVAPHSNKAASPDHSNFLGGSDVWISPGFVDLQVNGYGGFDFNLDSWTTGAEVPEAPWRIVELAARSGTPMLCPTVVTGSSEGMTRSLHRIAQAVAQEAHLARALPSIHQEGPYFSPEDGPRGAHPLQHLRLPDWEEFQHFQEAADGRIKIITLAPELPGALSFIEKVVETGTLVSLGHTAAAPSQIRDAVTAGATLSTHLGNGAHALLPRHPNYIWEQLAEDRLTAGIIADGHHLPGSVVRCIARVKGPDRLVLVSDAVSLGGKPAGLYDNGRHEVLPSGKVVLAGTPYLAGAGHLLDAGVANALRFTDLGLAGVTCAASTNPARLLGLDAMVGRVQPGYRATLSLFRLPVGEAPLDIVATLLDGEVVYRA